MDRNQSPWPDPDDIVSSEIDPDTGALHIHHSNGDITIDPSGGQSDDDDPSKESDPNIALELDDSQLATIAADLIDGIEADEASCATWRSNVASYIELMGLGVKPNGSAQGASGGAYSTVMHPMLADAIIRSQATAAAELLPAGGPVKMSSDDDDAYLGGIESGDDEAEALEKDFNHYLTAVETSFGPDTERMLLWRSTTGAGFKKVYKSPLRNRPVSECVVPQDLIVADGAVNLETARRITHEIMMRPSVLKRMQILGVYRDVDLMTSNQKQNAIDDKVAQTQGTTKSSRVEDEDHQIWECYCELDIEGFEHKVKGKPSGLPLPWRVTIHVESKQILEIRSNVLETEDDNALPVAREVFVLFPYIPGFGFWPIGLGALLGNSTKALTEAWRVLLDAGMFANFPGFFYLQTDARQLHNNFRIPPGGAVPIRPGSGPQDIRQLLMSAPYKDPSATFIQFAGQVADAGSKLGASGEVQVGEGRADAPVGTTLAMIEQATKVEAAAHKRAHMAQAKEFQLLKRLFKEDPEALWRDNPKANITDKATVLRALENAEIVPRSDPNTPSHLHRVMKLMGIKQLTAGNPAWNPTAVDEMIMEEGLGLSPQQIQSLKAPPQPPQAPVQPPVDPLKLANAQLAPQKLAFDKQKLIADLNDKAAERKSKENLKVLQLAIDTAIHPEGESAAEGILQQFHTIGPMQ